MSLKLFLLNLLFPIHCLGCSREDIWLCSDCFRRLEFLAVDKKFSLNIPHLDQLFIAGDYDDPLLAELIKKFKYNFIAPLGNVLADFLISFWRELLRVNSLAAPDFVIPIPLSKKRERWRGFNQAKILAEKFAVIHDLKLNDTLKRFKHNHPQASLPENKRLDNIKDVFRYDGEKLTGQNILLIDDVVTTGATLNEAAKVLKLAGAEKVYGLVLAKG